MHEKEKGLPIPGNQNEAPKSPEQIEAQEEHEFLVNRCGLYIENFKSALAFNIKPYELGDFIKSLERLPFDNLVSGDYGQLEYTGAQGNAERFKTLLDKLVFNKIREDIGRSKKHSFADLADIVARASELKGGFFPSVDDTVTAPVQE